LLFNVKVSSIVIVPVAVKLLVVINYRAVKASTSKLESKLTYKYPLKSIFSYVERVIVF
jgi:hypothetical protein